MMKCDVCGCLETYVKNYENSFLIKGKKIIVCSDRRFCKKCNNLVYDEELDNKVSEMAINSYNKNYGITKEQIIELRARYKLSQELFSKIIGCAKKTLISYEKGKSIPNDSYLIILKSLIAKPDTIITLIESNKEQFSDKEYEKINEKLLTSLPNNTRNLTSSENTKLNEFNGYTMFSKEKIYNVILYFAKDAVNKTKLLKEMFYADFLYYKNNCKSITGLEYSKLDYGPVPDQFEFILNKCVRDKVIDFKYIFENDFECQKVLSVKKFDESLFNDDEIKILKTVKDKFKNFNSKEIVEFSHKEKAFIDSEFYNKISYDYAFLIDSI